MPRTLRTGCMAYKAIILVHTSPAYFDSFDAHFIPVGHASMTDIAFASRRPSNQDTGALLKYFHDASKATALGCHAPAALAAAPRIDENWIYDGYRMICVSLLADQLAENIPFFNNGGHMPNHPTRSSNATAAELAIRC
jgi:putative intracellular protease/amidase